MWASFSSVSIVPSTPLVSPVTLKLTVPTKPAGFPTTALAAPCGGLSSFAVRGEAQEAEEISGNEKQGTSKQLSGLDVLWAMQKVTAVKKSKVKNRKRDGFSTRESSAGGDEEVSADYRNVRPVRVKREWAAKLDDLETRLRGLSEETK